MQRKLIAAKRLLNGVTKGIKGIVKARTQMRRRIHGATRGVHRFEVTADSGQICVLIRPGFTARCSVEEISIFIEVEPGEGIALFVGYYNSVVKGINTCILCLWPADVIYGVFTLGTARLSCFCII